MSSTIPVIGRTAERDSNVFSLNLEFNSAQPFLYKYSFCHCPTHDKIENFSKQCRKYGIDTMQKIYSLDSNIM